MNTQLKVIIGLSWMFLLIFFCRPAFALLITSSAELSGTTKEVTFDDQVGIIDIVGSIEVGDALGENIRLTATNPYASSSAGGPQIYSLGTHAAVGLNNNGWWKTSGISFVKAAPAGEIQFDFSLPVSGIGSFVNYTLLTSDPSPLVTISALYSDGTILESYNIEQLSPIRTPNGLNQGAFRGITRTSTDIYSVIFSAISDASTTPHGRGWMVVDNLMFSRPAPIPEPATIALLGIGLAGLAGAEVRRRRKKKAVDKT